MRERQAGFLGPGVELILDLPKILLRARSLGDIETGIAQAGHHVRRRDEAVLADEAKEVLPGAPAESDTALAEQIEQSHLVVGRPLRQELAEAAVLAGD